MSIAEDFDHDIPTDDYDDPGYVGGRLPLSEWVKQQTIAQFEAYDRMKARGQTFPKKSKRNKNKTLHALGYIEEGAPIF